MTLLATLAPSDVHTPESYESMRDRAGHLARRFWYSMRRIWWHSYWELEISGRENVPLRGPVLLCANHTSHLDAIAILAALPTPTALRTRTAAAKDVFGKNPVRAILSRVLTNALPIQRGSTYAGGLRTLEKVLRDRKPLILFPEGRRSPEGDLVEFKSGAAMLSIRTGTPIVPIRIDGIRDALARGQHVPLPATVHVRFGEPIDPRPYRDAITRGGIDRHAAYQQFTEQLKSAIEQLG
ncbi:MAG TPA: lysophospholipid acyltransferase family protein [Tepidisphaeraceae bacterium]|nr:lysophospholipid acyltransferase family protein [Tepidisphaeraceae bacterium]